MVSPEFLFDQVHILVPIMQFQLINSTLCRENIKTKLILIFLLPSPICRRLNPYIFYKKIVFLESYSFHL